LLFLPSAAAVVGVVVVVPVMPNNVNVFAQAQNVPVSRSGRKRSRSRPAKKHRNNRNHVFTFKKLKTDFLDTPRRGLYNDHRLVIQFYIMCTYSLVLLLTLISIRFYA